MTFHFENWLRRLVEKTTGSQRGIRRQRPRPGRPQRLLLEPLEDRLTPSSTINTVAGDHSLGGLYSGDGGPATSAGLRRPYAVAVDSHGNLFIADSSNNVIREVNATTQDISTVAGDHSIGSTYAGDGGPATSAGLNFPTVVALDSQGDLFIVDSFNNVIREVNATTHVISTVAGNNSIGGTYAGDGGPATSAGLSTPTGVALDRQGNLFIADSANNVIREVNATTHVISTVAGDNSLGGTHAGDGGPATSAGLTAPASVAVDNQGNLFIADTDNNLIREVNATTHNISTVAGDNSLGGTYAGDGGPATSAGMDLPESVAVDSQGNLFIADANNSVIREVNAITQNISTVAGDFSIAGTYSGDGGPATSAGLHFPTGVALDRQGDLFIADRFNHVIREVAGLAAIPGGYYEVTSNADSSNAMDFAHAGTLDDPYLAPTLRSAINAANAASSPVTIVFAPSVTSGGPAKITLSTVGDSTAGPSDFGISGYVTIEGSTSGNGITLDNSGSQRLFYVSATGNLTLHNLTLQGGTAQGGAGGSSENAGTGGGGAGLGGAVFDDGGTFTALGCTFTNNTATGGQGGAVDSSGTYAAGGGGGLGAAGDSGSAGGLGHGGGGAGGVGSLVVDGGVGGFGGGGGGGNFGTLSGHGVGGRGGFGGGGGGNAGAAGFGGGGGGTNNYSHGGVGGGGAGLGGGIFSNGGTLTLTNDTFTANTATGGTGANAGSGYGGAVFVRNGSLKATFDTFSANTAAQGGTSVYVLSDNVGGGSGAVSATLVDDLLGQTDHSLSDFLSSSNGTATAPTLSASNDFVSNNPSPGGLPSTAVVNSAGADQTLGGLAFNNSGPTQTLALLPGSPAIGAGVAVSAIPTDQNGVRHSNPPDLGAYQSAVTTYSGTSITVGSDGKTRILETKQDGSTSLQSVTNAYAVTNSRVYGPFSGWTATAVAAGPDGLTRELWQNTNGQSELWLLDSAGTRLSYHVLGLSRGWTVIGLSVGSDNKARLLWTNVDGRMQTWSVDNSYNFTYGPVYGGYAGWTATNIAADAAGSDGLTRVLWHDSNGLASLWLLDATGTRVSSHLIGISQGWSVQDISVGSDNQTRVLYTNADGRMMTWSVDDSFNFTYQTTYGPYVGFTATSIAAGADGMTRVLWHSADGRTALWLLDSSGNLLSDQIFAASS